jgi:hypothetical protein
MAKKWNYNFLKTLLAGLFQLPNGYFFGVICGLIAVMPLSAQIADTFLLRTTFPGEAKFIVADKLQQIYVVSPDQRLLKYNTDGKLLFDYSNRTLGQLGWVDVTDPFNVLLFFPDYQNLIFLDRTLNVAGEMRLPINDFPNVTLVAMGRDNYVWLYDAVLFRLRKVGKEGEIIKESQDLSQLFGRDTPTPSQLVTTDQAIYLVDTLRGLFQFDLFGNFQKRFPEKNIRHLQAIGGYLFYQKGEQSFFRNEYNQEVEIKGFPKKLNLFYLLPEILVGANGKSIQVYEFKKQTKKGTDK